LTGSQIRENVFRISKASQPCVKSHSRFTCNRDALLANSFIKEDYENSNHTRVYIGEWHTHSEQNPKPSSIDCNSIIMNYKTSKLVIPILIMIIVGTIGFHISIYDGKAFYIIKPFII
jgi:integrative and conjugative element protein (TIGR02256 family)